MYHTLRALSHQASSVKNDVSLVCSGVYDTIHTKRQQSTVTVTVDEFRPNWPSRVKKVTVDVWCEWALTHSTYTRNLRELAEIHVA